MLSWVNWANLGEALHGRPVALRAGDGRIEVFAHGMDDRLHHIYQITPNDGWADWESLSTDNYPLPTQAVGNPTVGINQDGRLEVFVRGADQNLYHIWKLSPSGDWSNWEPFSDDLGRRTLGDASVLLAGDGRLEVFVRGDDNVLYHKWQVAPNDGWSEWESFSHEYRNLGTEVVGAVAVGINEDGRLEVFARGGDHVLYHIWKLSPSGEWSEWNSISGDLGRAVADDPAVALAGDGRLELFVLGDDGVLYHRWQTAPNDDWSDWESFSRNYRDIGTGVVGVAAVGLDQDRCLDVVARGADGALHHIRKLDPSGEWSDWQSMQGLSGAPQSDPSIVANADGRLEAFVLGADGGLYHSWQTMVPTFVDNLVDGNTVLPRLLGDIMAASRTINIAVFLFFNDPIGQEIANALIDRARAGAKVRVLVNLEKTALGDPFSTGEKGMFDEDPHFSGDPLDSEGLARMLRNGGVEVIDTNIDYDRIVNTDDPAFNADETDIRNTIDIDALHVDHRKIVTIDGRIGYCGSANFGAQYLYHEPFDPNRLARDEATERIRNDLPEPWVKWHDGLVRFEGPTVAQFDRVFRERWVLDGGGDFGPTQPAAAGSGATGAGVVNLQIIVGQPNGKTNPVRELFKRMIASASGSIFIEHSYLYHPEIVDALIAARRRNRHLRIDLILPAAALNDSSLSADAQEFRYQRYIRAGIRVFEYQNHFTHMKIATFDERFSIVGSTNLNYRSLDNDRDFEVAVLAESPELAQQINRDVRDVDLAHVREFTRRDVLGIFSPNWPINSRDQITIAAEIAREL
jgi:phosphatidylserine/phosphatidylglycerophosphate/cardiolipin synthase-like enzyme